MTIDDFDVNEISDKLAVREEADDPHTLEAAHGDGHDDNFLPCPHGDVTNPPWHNDSAGCANHDDGHYDVFDDCCCCFDDCCPKD